MLKKIIWLSNLLTLSVPDKGVVRTKFDIYIFITLIQPRKLMLPQHTYVFVHGFVYKFSCLEY